MGRYSDAVFSSGRGGRSYTGRGRGKGRGWGKGRGRGRGHYNKGLGDKENENNANFTTNGNSPQNDGVGSIKDLANQIQTINSTIRDTLLECAETNESLIGLQSQLGEAMKRVGKVNKNLISLQTHTHAVLQKSLEMVKSEEEVAQHQVDMPVTPEKQHRPPLVETTQSVNCNSNDMITPYQQHSFGMQQVIDQSFEVRATNVTPEQVQDKRVAIDQTLNSLETVSVQFVNEDAKLVTPIQGEELPSDDISFKSCQSISDNPEEETLQSMTAHKDIVLDSSSFNKEGDLKSPSPSIETNTEENANPAVPVHIETQDIEFTAATGEQKDDITDEESQQQEVEKSRAKGWQDKIAKEDDSINLISQLITSEFVRKNKDKGLTEDQVNDDLYASQVIADESKNANDTLFGGIKCRVKVTGSEKQDLNGRMGTLRYWDANEKKFCVGLDTKKAKDCEEHFLSPENVELIGSIPRTDRNNSDMQSYHVDMTNDFLSQEGDSDIGCQFTIDKATIASIRSAESIPVGLAAFSLEQTEKEKVLCKNEAWERREAQEEEEEEDDDDNDDVISQQTSSTDTSSSSSSGVTTTDARALEEMTGLARKEKAEKEKQEAIELARRVEEAERSAVAAVETQQLILAAIEHNQKKKEENTRSTSIADSLPHSDQEAAVSRMLQDSTTNHGCNDELVAKSMVHDELDVQDANAQQNVEQSFWNNIDKVIDDCPKDQVEHKTTASTTKKSTVVASLASKKKKVLVVDKLSSYIKPRQSGSNTEYSPIFSMLQNKNTAEDGRKLMILEVEQQTCEKELKGLMKQRSRLEGSIRLEKNCIKECRAGISEADRSMLLRWGISSFSGRSEREMITLLDRVANEGVYVGSAYSKGKKSMQYMEIRKAMGLVQSKKRIMLSALPSLHEQEQALDKVASSIPTNVVHLDKVRANIAELKGSGIVVPYDTTQEKKAEVFHIDIDRNRDDRGFTFLMIAAQNGDLLAAKTCFDLGAKASTTSPGGLTAIDFSYFFGFEHVTNLILNNGGILPKKQSEVWAGLESVVATSSSESKNWDVILKVAETAALPAETLMESPETCENDKDKRMPILSPQECRDMDFTCFESRLVDSNINSDQVKRVVLLDQNVYNWCLNTDQTSRANFANLLEGLKPVSVRREGVQETRIHRRAIIGAATTFEVLSAKFKDSSKGERTALFTPFVSGEVNGITNIGVLVWTVAPDSEASLYKTLIANTEFMRHKVKQDDRFLPHKESVLELGKDMHLLDLQSTSIWTTSTMNLYILNLDNGDLDRIDDPAFTAKKRIVYSEDKVNRAIFQTSREEEKSILASARRDMSTLLTGGAGTGKTLLVIRKVVQEDSSRKILVVSRLSRLVKVIKTAVEERRDDGAKNQSFTTYDDLLQLLAKRVTQDKGLEYKSFVQFDRVRFDCDDSNISFSRQFVAGHLNTNERREMSKNLIEELTLWHAIIVIKSQAKCATSKQPLSLDDYLALPASFGLTGTQRELCYALFLKYEQWRESERFWDEMDRVLYVLKFGPSVFKDDHFIPWAHRVNKFGQMDLLDEEGEPLYPFFYDIVCADEAQDFTEIDLILFSKMSASLFLSADPAQSVELGVKMREGTVNDVVHSLVKDKKKKVKDVLQYISLQTNHRTHAQNLAIGQAVRRILARSFSVPITNEIALINGQQPKALSVNNVSDLADTSVFCGGNIVFLAPDEKVHDLRLQFSELGIQNDIFGVREAKGLEFDAVALIGFFSYIEERGSSNEWHNVLRWLSSSSSLTKTSSTGEKIAGVMLEDCDYRLSAPNVSDEAMMLYTALTRARNFLYLIEVEQKGKKAISLADFAFRRFSDLGLLRQVAYIDDGEKDMNPAQHKARGVLYVTQALELNRNHSSFSRVKEKFTAAMKRFSPNKGNDKELLDKCEKHFKAVREKRSLIMYAKENFLKKGEWNLEGLFDEVLQFEQKASHFISQFLCDSFLSEEIRDVRCLLQEIFEGTPYESHFNGICQTIETLE